MPATEGTRQPVSQGIPFRRVLLNDPSQLPIDYSSTPGGTLYSTTPGGTRIVYERSTLMHLRNSPLSRTPPNVPDFLAKGASPLLKDNKHPHLPTPVRKVSPVEECQEQFDIDI